MKEIKPLSLKIWYLQELYKYFSTQFELCDFFVVVGLLSIRISSGYLNPIFTYFLRCIHPLSKSPYNSKVI